MENKTFKVNKLVNFVFLMTSLVFFNPDKFIVDSTHIEKNEVTFSHTLLTDLLSQNVYSVDLPIKSYKR